MHLDTSPSMRMLLRMRAALPPARILERLEDRFVQKGSSFPTFLCSHLATPNSDSIWFRRTGHPVGRLVARLWYITTARKVVAYRDSINVKV